MLARMSKKALALLMVFCMVVSALSVGALAAVDTPNGTYDGILTFEYHVTASALKDMVKNETEYTYDDIHGATLFFEDCSRDLVWNWAPDIYWTAVSALEEKHPQDMIALELYLDNGCTQKTLRFSDEELQAMFYEEAASGFYEIQLKDSGSGEPTDPELALQYVYVYVDAKDGQGTPNDHGYFTVGKIQMKLPKASEVVAGDNYYAQYGSSVSLENIERFAANSWLDLADVNWYMLRVADGADDYVESGTYVWHLDGELLDEVQLYNVTYDANGGTGTVPVDPQGYAAGQPFAALSGAGLTREGYTFLGWSTNKDAAAADTSFTMAQGGITLYAVWQKNEDPQPATYTVTFKTEAGGTINGGSADVSGTYEEGAAFPAIPETKADEGYTFNGWYDANGNKMTEWPATVTASATYTAKWTKDGDPQPNTYTITFKTEAGGTINGGTDDVTGTYTEGAAFPERPTTAANSGYSFDGWYDANGNKVTEWPTTVTASATYTAKWTEDGGTPPTPSYDYYRVTVNYLDRADGSKIAESYVSASLREGSHYDVSEHDAISISGYVYDATEGDALSGVVNGNKTINVYYMADETDIGDGETPTTDLPDVPGEGGGETDIGDGETPTTDLPDTGDTGSTGDGSETDIPDGQTPTGSLPQTGTQAQVSMARVALSVMALTASVAAAGLALILFRKSRKNA